MSIDRLGAYDNATTLLRAPVALDLANGGLVAEIAAPGRIVVTETDEMMVSLGVAADPAAPFEPAIAVARINSSGIQRMLITDLAAYRSSVVWLVTQELALPGELQAGMNRAQDELLSRGYRPVDAAALRPAIPFVGLLPGGPTLLYEEETSWRAGRVILPIGLAESTEGLSVLFAAADRVTGEPRIDMITALQNLLKVIHS